MKFRIADIKVVDRKRGLENITPLADSIQELGLINPITILPNGTLVAGFHRLSACKLLEWEEIDVSVVNFDSLDAELAEIDENLIRNELHWLDRDKQLKRRKEIYEEKENATKHGGDRRGILSQLAKSNGDGRHLVSSFTQDTSNKTNIADRTIRESIQRANAFTEEQGEILKQADVTQTEATRLARMEEQERARIINSLAERQSQGVPSALQTSESNEWYTPSIYIEAVRELMGEIDIDPASNAYVNEKIVKATTYYNIEANGLSKKWNGRVWINPPYGYASGSNNQGTWSHYLIRQFEDGITKEAVLLVNANTEAKWFQPLYDYLICFTNHRIRFYNIDGISSQPTQGNAFVYFGHQRQRFIQVFKQFGTIVRKV